MSFSEFVFGMLALVGLLLLSFGGLHTAFGLLFDLDAVPQGLRILAAGGLLFGLSAILIRLTDDMYNG